MIQKITLGIAVIALIVGGVAITRSNQVVPTETTLGATTVFQKTSFTEGLFAGSGRQVEISRDGGFKLGSSGTAVTRINTGTCYIQSYATTIAATSSATVECQATALVRTTATTFTSPLTGVASGDAVNVTLSTATAGTTVGGLTITAATASTTAGYISLRVYNGTGATFTWPVTGSATGTASYIVTK